MKYILGIKFRDYGQIYFFTLPEEHGRPADEKNTATSPEPIQEVPGEAVVPDGDPFVPQSLEGDPDEVLESLGPSACAQAAPDCGVRVGDVVIAETGQGLGFGVVVHVSTRAPGGVDQAELKPILRVAGEADAAALTENQNLTRDAFSYCTSRIRTRELEMKLVDVEILFDKTKFIFYFTAPTRIDFRELVKDLVREYHVRIELRQIGVRHETQMIGAVGNCGMVCCCRRFLRKFAPVTIKMAKEQNLFLNPAKISGICGRLLCCLSYEQENYDAFHRECPRLGKRYQTNRGEFKVLRANMFRNCVIALNSLGEEEEISLEDWQASAPRRPDTQPAPPKSPGEKPQKPQGEGFMVVTADPDTLDELEDLPTEQGEPEGQGKQAPAQVAHARSVEQTTSPRVGEGDNRPENRPRRKRKRRPQ